MKKILVIYNCSGIVRDLYDMWYNHLMGILNQDYENYHVCVSGCKISDNSKEKLINLKQQYPNKLSLIFIDDILPVNITFNKSCIEMSKNNDYDVYMYVASDVSFNNDRDVLTRLCDLHFSRNDIGITSAVVNYDSGIEPWLGAEVFNNILERENYIVPVGKTCNLHAMLFDKKIFEAYDTRIIPDIFRTYCTESVFSFITASLKLKFIIHNKSLLLTHLGHSDGSSGGFTGIRGWTDLYLSKIPVEQRLMSEDAWNTGFGYEECQNIFMHNQSKYNENDNHINPDELLDFNKKNIFLSSEEFDYNSVNVIRF
jgi:hypothetical protein